MSSSAIWSSDLSRKLGCLWAGCEVKAFVGFFVGLGLCAMSFVAGRRISHSIGGGVAACLGAATYLHRVYMRLKEGPQLDLRQSKLLVQDKVYVVTGGGRGIGLEVSSLLAELGAKQIIICLRNAQKRSTDVTAAVVKRANSFAIRGTGDYASLNPEAIAQKLKFVELDLLDYASVKSAAEQVKTLCPRIDGLCCNAGVARGSNLLKANWAGHVVFIEALKDRLNRVVLLSSIGHAAGDMRLVKMEDEPVVKFDMRNMIQYGNTKLAMIFEARYLFKEYGLQAASVHPGMVATDMLFEAGFVLLLRLFAKTPLSGAMGVVKPLIDTTIVPGGYYTGLSLAPEWPITDYPEQYEKYLELRKQMLATVN